MTSKWYVIHTLTGQEEKVKTTIEGKIQEGALKEKVFQVLIPTEQVSEVKDGKKKISLRKFFPGYVLLEMDLDDETWYVVRNIPGVTGFIGTKTRPTPLLESEVNHIIKQTEERKEKPTPKVIFEKGDSVKIIEGPFINFSGIVEEVNPDKGKVKVMVSIFGRATPVEMEYWQVERL
ncbi:MAG: transcription termination/antitermination protein NusG [Candidatus Omnitrophica bacterium]|nr:transcription termination/antitermination protein NusG [Candidatus Omnitrophota bacterium]MBU4457560.1 transcription termination/antitermination protein NusG [Candidatus Omnitrophota bacterium]